MTTKDIGNFAEAKAVDHLISKGYAIVTTQFHSKQGEIDIIAQNDEFIVFVEVKYRKNPTFGSGIENVTRTKIKRILKTANYYIYKNQLRDVNFRFDIIQIHGSDYEITHLENAFGA